MSEPPPRPPPPPDSLSLQGVSHPQTPIADGTPPPPPPKPSGNSGAGVGTPPVAVSSTGTPSGAHEQYQQQQQYHQQYQQQQYHQQQQQQQHPPPPPPPALEDGWLPSTLREQTKPDLETLLADAKLLDAILRAGATAHPSLPASDGAVQAQLAQNQALATHVSSVAAAVAQQRADVSSRLLQLRALERQWHLKQAAMDDALAPFSPKALHARLVTGIAEQESLLDALEESFLETDGRATDRDVADFLKRWRDGRRVLGLRSERRRRFEEGRVGGWR